MSTSFGSNLISQDKVALSIKSGLRAVPELAERFGWAYVLAWLHRISAIILSIYFLFHIVTLSSLQDPVKYTEKMEFFTSPFFLFLVWALSLPLIFHAINGARLMLYESFGIRHDNLLIRLSILFVVLYSLFLGIMMIFGNQDVTPIFFWGLSFVIGALAAFLLWAKLRSTRHSWLWTAQRITAAYLLIVMPAHMLFTHLNVSMAHDAAIVTQRMSLGFIQFVDLTLVLSVAYHAAYGLISISKDYLQPRSLYARGFSAATILLMGFMALWGIKIAFIAG
jgi:succinate dehydrogenase hydrophobic anchor subunit